MNKSKVLLLYPMRLQDQTDTLYETKQTRSDTICNDLLPIV